MHKFNIKNIRYTFHDVFLIVLKELTTRLLFHEIVLNIDQHVELLYENFVVYKKKKQRIN